MSKSVITFDLRAARLALDLSQAELAEKLGVTPNTLARWERGELRIAKPEMLRLAVQHLSCQRS